MSALHRPLSYTDVEIRSYLPSGWGISPGSQGGWNAEQKRWSIEVYDGADNQWTVAVAGADADAGGRIAALKTAIDRLTRKQLGRKSILSG
ncbi:MAG: hypothetical protein NDJ75_12135 [Thermoanaerobaculia bacterium]|nr:hypothetical protein [Thermoanaerobaculia bacterium]